jgi:hypothetical protein
MPRNSGISVRQGGEDVKVAMRELAGTSVSAYDLAEQKAAAAVAVAFDLIFPHPPVTKLADAIVLGLEADRLFGAGTAELWGFPTAKPEHAWARGDLDLETASALFVELVAATAAQH